jgi:GNAT superfamily N-acetyltransferase
MQYEYHTDKSKFLSTKFVKPQIDIKIIKGNRKLWDIFKKHHYLNDELPLSTRCFFALWHDNIIGFSSSISFPGKTPPLYEGDIRKKWRECRTVLIPDFQGLGIGTRFSDAIADIHIDQGYRYFSKTSHMRMGLYRQQSLLWKATSANLIDRSKSTHSKNGYLTHHKIEKKRICYSHEYIGENNKSYDPKNNAVKDSQFVLF